MMENREKLVNQYRAVQESGVVNMLDRFGVQYYAHKTRLYDLVVLCEDSRDYGKFLASFTPEDMNVKPDENIVKELRLCLQSEKG